MHRSIATKFINKVVKYLPVELLSADTTVRAQKVHPTEGPSPSDIAPKEVSERLQRENEIKTQLKFYWKLQPPPPAEKGTPPEIIMEQFAVPSELPRPDFAEIDLETLYAAFPEFTGLDIGFIKKQIDSQRTTLFNSLCGHTVNVVRNQDGVATGLETRFNEDAAILPSSLLFVHGLEPQTPDTPKPVFYFIHSLVFALECAYFILPEARTLERDENGAEKTPFEILGMAIPHPETFPHIYWYLYSKDLEAFKVSLLPPLAPPPSLLESPEQFERYAECLAKEFSAEVIKNHITLVLKTFNNFCALGIFDPDLWCTVVEGLWKVLLRALELRVGEPTVIPIYPPPPTLPEPSPEPELQTQVQQPDTTFPRISGTGSLVRPGLTVGRLVFNVPSFARSFLRLFLIPSC